ncbi:MAG: LysM peptidoglycan-binding domain-containing protein [Peptococcaceae bacterium]|nr:LysM peptidoglycan-binding domain-containing protein [Peptococcaceae bacterium]
MFKKLMMVISVFLVMVLVMQVVGPSRAAIVVPTKPYIVERGDTLWGLAERFAPNSMDLREYVFRLRRLNDLQHSATIHPGQRLYLPSP